MNVHTHTALGLALILSHYFKRLKGWCQPQRLGAGVWHIICVLMCNTKLRKQLDHGITWGWQAQHKKARNRAGPSLFQSVTVTVLGSNLGYVLMQPLLKVWCQPQHLGGVAQESFVGVKFLGSKVMIQTCNEALISFFLDTLIRPTSPKLKLITGP